MENNYFKQYYRSWFRHPVYNLLTFLNGIKYALQRATRGYSDRDTWDIDSFLVTIMPAMLRKYKKECHGYPGDLTEEKWDSILDEMIEGFEAAKRVIDDEYYLQGIEDIGKMNRDQIEKIEQLSLADQDLFNSKMKLFTEYFFNLWD